MTRRAVWLFALIVPACGSTHESAPRPVAPSGAQASSPLPFALQDLQRSVEAIPAAPLDEAPRRIHSALGAVAHALQDDNPAAAKELRTLARQVAKEHEPAAVRRALLLALDTLAPDTSSNTSQPARRAYELGRRAASEVTNEEPLRFQLFEVAAAMRAVTNLVATRRGEDPPFSEPRLAIDVGYDRSELEASAQRASVLVGELASEVRWDRAAKRAADVLAAFAEAVRVSPSAWSREEWRVLVRSIRYEALVLGQDNTFDRSDHIKAGLRASLVALRGLRHGAYVPPQFIKRANAAIESIDERNLIALQRGAIQEAFRSLADAFLSVQVSEEWPSANEAAPCC